MSCSIPLLKNGRKLFDCVDEVALRVCLAEVRSRGTLAAIAGSLAWADLAQIRDFAPDIAGFRGALCFGHETRVGGWTLSGFGLLLLLFILLGIRLTLLLLRNWLGCRRLLVRFVGTMGLLSRFYFITIAAFPAEG